MKTSTEKQRLIDEASRADFTVTPKQLDRWRADQVLPPAGTAGAGRARGVQRPAPEGSAAQLIRLCQFLGEDRSLDRAAFQLWIEDYPIPLARLRKALARLVPGAKRLFGATPELGQNKMEQYGENIRRRKSVPPHVKKMIDEGRFASVLGGFLRMGLGQPVPAEEQQKLGADFEELSGLNRARTDHWAGQSPWLTGDTTPQLELAAAALEATNYVAESAPEEDFLKARDAFKGFLMLRRCAALLQQLHGPNVFGFGVLTDLPIGVPIKYADPAAFLGMVFVAKAHPEILDNIIQMGKSLQSTLDELRNQVENRNNATA